MPKCSLCRNPAITHQEDRPTGKDYQWQTWHYCRSCWTMIQAQRRDQDPWIAARYRLFLEMMNESQRALVAARIANLKRGQKKSDASNDASSQTEAASILNVSRSEVQRARNVVDKGAPALVRGSEKGLEVSTIQDYDVGNKNR